MKTGRGKALPKVFFKALSFVLAAGAALVFATPASASSVGTDAKQADVAFTAGGGSTPLKIVTGAANLTFGTHDIQLMDMFYTEASGSPIAVTVEDLRGTGAGWKLQAQLAHFLNGTDNLPGAEITFRSGAIAHNFGGGSAAATGGSATLVADGATVNILTAGTAAGMGQTILTWAAATGSGESSTATSDPIELKVAAGTPKALTYTAVLTWDLIDAP